MSGPRDEDEHLDATLEANDAYQDAMDEQDLQAWLEDERNKTFFDLGGEA